MRAQTRHHTRTENFIQHELITKQINIALTGIFGFVLNPYSGIDIKARTISSPALSAYILFWGREEEQERGSVEFINFIDSQTNIKVKIDYTKQTIQFDCIIINQCGFVACNNPHMYLWYLLETDLDISHEWPRNRAHYAQYWWRQWTSSKSIENSTSQSLWIGFN